MTACSLSPALKCAGRFCPQVNAAPIPIEAGTNVGGLPNNWWYSFNIGNAHFVSLNSDVVTNPVVVTNTSRYRWNYPVSVRASSSARSTTFWRRTWLRPTPTGRRHRGSLSSLTTRCTARARLQTATARPICSATVSRAITTWPGSRC